MEWTEKALRILVSSLKSQELAIVVALGNENLTTDFVIGMAKSYIKLGNEPSTVIGFIAGCRGFPTVRELAVFFWSDPELWMPIEKK